MLTTKAVKITTLLLQTERQRIADKSLAVKLTSVGELGKKVGVGRNTMYKILRDLRILDESNEPYPEFVKADFIRNVATGIYNRRDSTIEAHQTLFTAKGIQWLLEDVLKPWFI